MGAFFSAPRSPKFSLTPTTLPRNTTSMPSTLAGGIGATVEHNPPTMPRSAVTTSEVVAAVLHKPSTPPVSPTTHFCQITMPVAHVLILVLSRDTPDGAMRRTAIRKSWGAVPKGVHALFVRGGASADESEGLKRADELIVASPEGLTTIALKVLRALRWVTRSPCAPSSWPAFVAKTDDDTFVCVAELLRQMHSHARLRRTEYLYMGAMTYGRKVETRPNGHWTDAPYARLFGLTTYPDYAQGAFYVLSAAAATSVVQVASELELFNRSVHPNPRTTPINEDALIGTLLHVARGSLVDYRRLPVRVYPSHTRKLGHSAAAVRRENERACKGLDRRSALSSITPAVAIHELELREIERCADLAAHACKPTTVWTMPAATVLSNMATQIATEMPSYEQVRPVMGGGTALAASNASSPPLRRTALFPPPLSPTSLAHRAARSQHRPVTPHHPGAQHRLTANHHPQQAPRDLARLSARAHIARTDSARAHDSVRPHNARPHSATRGGASAAPSAVGDARATLSAVWPSSSLAAASNRDSRLSGGGQPGGTPPYSSMTPPGPVSTLSTRRVAFCFLLGYGDVAQPDLWLAFFGRAAHNELLAGPNEDLFSVYAHQDARLFDQPANKRVVSRPFWRHALIPPAWRVTTDYRNGTSLELARMALFRYALEDNPTNYKFVLLSESCIPLHPLSHMHSRLTRDPRPRVHEMPDVRPETRPEAPTDDTVRERMGPGAWPSTSRSSLKRGKRWVASMAPLITQTRRGSLLQARQFVIAGRAEVERFPGADEIASTFGPMTRAEEHVFCARGDEHLTLISHLSFSRIVLGSFSAVMAICL